MLHKKLAHEVREGRVTHRLEGLEKCVILKPNPQGRKLSEIIARRCEVETECIVKERSSPPKVTHGPHEVINATELRRGNIQGQERRRQSQAGHHGSRRIELSHAETSLADPTVLKCPPNAARNLRAGPA
jgi:phosphoribosylpyrophosphate synthetase